MEIPMKSWLAVSFPNKEVLFCYILILVKSCTWLTELDDGSNESLYHPDEESDPNLQKGIPLQKNLKIIDVFWYVGSAFLAPNSKPSLCSLEGKVASSPSVDFSRA